MPKHRSPRGKKGPPAAATPSPRGQVRVVDSPELAQARRDDLALDRGTARRLGQETVAYATQGWYPDAAGRRVDWSATIAAAKEAKISIPPDAKLPVRPAVTFSDALVQVANETSLGAARRLVEEGRHPLVLNMANGVHPGGGFLTGSRAQEEYLCRSSALYATLEGDPMYAAHATRPAPDSTAWAILSPDVPVFRDDAGTPLDEPWPASFISSTAPYAPAIGQPRSAELLDARIGRVLQIARAYGYTALVLGAWGCGAFGNDTGRAARSFRRHLDEHRGAFERVVFAIADWSPDRHFLGPFAEAFGGDPADRSG